MPTDQFSAFVELLPQIEEALVGRGEKVVRPQYDAQVKEEEGGVDEADLSDVGDENGGPKKSNIEATSDEDED